MTAAFAVYMGFKLTRFTRPLLHAAALVLVLACATERPPPADTGVAELTGFPNRQVLVVLKTDDDSVLNNPQGDAALSAVYAQRGAPAIARPFPGLKDRGATQRQVVRGILVPHRIAQKRARLGLREGLHTPPLHRFRVLTFPTAGPLAPLLDQLENSPSIQHAYPNLIAKLAAQPGAPFYAANLGWLAPYGGELLGLSPGERAGLPFISANIGWLVLDKLDDTLPDLRTYYTRESAKNTTHWQFRGRRPERRSVCQVPAGAPPRCRASEVNIRFDDSLTETQELALLAQWGYTRRGYNVDSDVHRVAPPAGTSVAAAMAFLEAPARAAQVLYAEPTFFGTAHAIAPDDPLYPQQWALNANVGLTNSILNAEYVTQIFAEDVWDHYTFDNQVTVAVIDSGVMIGHDDFYAAGFGHDNTNLVEDAVAEISWMSNSNFAFTESELSAFVLQLPAAPSDPYPYDWMGWDFITYPDPTAPATIAAILAGAGTAPLDHCRSTVPHGTMMSSIIGARANNAYGMSGVSMHNAIKLLPIAALEDASTGSCAFAYTTVNLGLGYAFAKGADVVNLSIGSPMFNQEMFNLIQDHPEITFVASAGNDIENLDEEDSYPCELELDNVVCVGSRNPLGELAFFTSPLIGTATGASVDFYLPGTGIGAASWNTTTQAEDFTLIQGTSASTAYASGVAALAISRCPLAAGTLVAAAMRDWLGGEPEAAGDLSDVLDDIDSECGELGQPDPDAPPDYNEPPECAECDCKETCPHAGCTFSASQLACDKGGEGCTGASVSTPTGLGAAVALLSLVVRRRRRRTA